MYSPTVVHGSLVVNFDVGAIVSAVTNAVNAGTVSVASASAKTTTVVRSGHSL